MRTPRCFHPQPLPATPSASLGPLNLLPTQQHSLLPDIFQAPLSYNEYLLYPSTSFPPPPHPLIFLSPPCFLSPAHASPHLTLILLSSSQLSSYSSSKTALPKEQAHCLLPASFPTNSGMSVFLNYCHGVVPSHGSDSTHSGGHTAGGNTAPSLHKGAPTPVTQDARHQPLLSLMQQSGATDIQSRKALVHACSAASGVCDSVWP